MPAQCGLFCWPQEQNENSYKKMQFNVHLV